MANNCQYCGKKIPLSKAFCSKVCKESYFQKIVISIPKPFLKRIYFFCSEAQREEEIIKFAIRHDWDYSIVKDKIEEAYEMHFEKSS